MGIRRQNRRVSDGELNALLASFNNGTNVDEDGRIHFIHLDWASLQHVLPDAFDIDKSLTRPESRALIRSALLECRKSGPVSVDLLIAAAQRLVKAELSKRPQKYSMWGKFRAKFMGHQKAFRLAWGDVHIETTYCLPKYMNIDEYFFNGYGDINPQENSLQGHLVARCEARTAQGAAARMFDAIDLFMAIFNMYEGWGRRRISSGPWIEGKLLNGPYFFMFRGREFLKNVLWFDESYNEEAWNSDVPDMGTVLRLVPLVRRVLATLANHPLREVLVSVLRLMQSAMSTREQGYRLLRYWSALEQLHGEPDAKSRNYARIVQRATFAEPDKLVARWKLAHISRIRNEYVHAGVCNDDLRYMSNYLRMLLSRHIDYLLFRAPDIRSHQQWLDMVDLPDDEATLNMRKATIEKRIELIHRRHKQAAEAS
jgi:hypothetical protein